MISPVLISHGRVPQSEPWRILEVAIGQPPDVLAIRIAKEFKRLRLPAEALVPMRRNQDGEAEWIIEHVYVRGAQISRLTGIEFQREEIAPKEWIEQLLAADSPLIVGPQAGDFVRVLTGPCARLCGTVTKRDENDVSISIEMRTKKVTVHTNIQNVQPVDCPPDRRSFFYQSDLT